MMRGSFFALAVALCSVSSCDSEVTLHLLNSGASDSGGEGSTVAGADNGGGGAAADGGGGLVASGGTAGMSGSLGDAGAGASAGDGGDTPPACDLKLGAEVCNGGDDNCDGAIDEGCAFTLKWKDDPERPALGKPGAKATEFAQPCPNGSLLVGMHVGMGTRLDQVAAVCQQFELSPDPTAQTPTSISFTSATPLVASIAPATSKETDTITEMLCPPGLFVTSLDGTTTAADPQYTQRIQISCSPPLIANGVLGFDSTKTQALKAVACSGCTSSATLDYDAPLAAGHVPSGLFGRDGIWVDLVGVSTAVARVAPR